jgi:hypothetical protein
MGDEGEMDDRCELERPTGKIWHQFALKERLMARTPRRIGGIMSGGSLP